MMNDRVSDLLARLRNAYKAELQVVKTPYSGLLAAICAVLAA